MTEPHVRLRRITPVIADLSCKPWTDLRILDLGSLEGQFSLEFASKGAQVVANEGREANNTKARAAAASRGLGNVGFITDECGIRCKSAMGRLMLFCALEFCTTFPEKLAAT
jgi:2-polyprenyl-3-methyl-5-hydroxy-6-metoxy-1,4-benzoquinol methylase